MRIGYVGQNLSLDCTPASTFRLASYSAERLRTTVASNLACMERVLEYNAEHGLLYYRITSDLVPFASHEVCDFDWQTEFAGELARLGAFVREHGMRVAMHPGQYILIGSPDEGTFRRSVAELVYHAQVLDLMGMDTSAKLQIHVGGVYGDKAASSARFVERCAGLPPAVLRRLAIENDERLYGVADCVKISEAAGIPIIFDDFHFRLKDDGLPYAEAVALVRATWGAADGVPLVDYSSQQPDKRFGSHATTLDDADFLGFLERIGTEDADVMLEIKDKNLSAVRALALMKARGR
jgi:UV DNA damage endonuclease